jgi:ribosome-associated protein
MRPTKEPRESEDPLSSSEPAPAKTKTAPKARIKIAPKASVEPQKTPEPKTSPSEPKAKKTTRPVDGTVKKASRGGSKLLKNPPKTVLSGRDLAVLVAAAANEHKLVSPVLLNLTGLSSVADWFFIASLDNSRQVRAVADKIVQRLREAGLKPLGQEGLTGGECRWALLDLGEVIVHLFLPEARAYYDLEGLWPDAPRVEELDEIRTV